MDHINTLLPEGYPKLTIFDDEEVYLPMLKIGKNNPKEAEIIAANELRTAWNQIADQAMVEGVPQADIKKIKQVEIMEAARKSIKEHGKEPGRFNRILREAMQHLRKLILKIRDAVKSPEVVPEEPIHHKSDIYTDEKKPVIPEKPVEPELSKRFKSYYATHKKLEGVGKEIRKLEDKLEALQKELSKTTGFFKGKERNRIIGEIADTQVEISQKRASLSKIAIKAKCGSVEDFYTKYNASKASHNEYMKKLKAWEDKYGSGAGMSAPKGESKGKETPKKTQEDVSTPKRMLNMVSMRAELQKKKKVVKERDEHREPTIIKKKENNIGLE